MTTIPSFEHNYSPGAIHYGRNCVADLAVELNHHNVERALVVCGATVGSTPGAIEPIKEGIGDCLAGVFARTTPEKHIGTAYEGLERMRTEEIDAIVGLGGGSSIDLAKAMCALETDDRAIDEIASEVERTGVIEVRGDPVVFIVVPTTLAGADLSMGCSPRFPPERPGSPPDEGEIRTASVVDPRLMPRALFYDPDVFATTPNALLAGSAMNGFDKAVEKLYSRNANPIADTTAIRALELLRSGLPNLVDGSDQALEETIVGIILAQYAWFANDSAKTSILHAFGHAFSRHFPVQQGIVHGIVIPHVLRYLFDRVDARRQLLSEGLGIDSGTDDVAEEIINVIVGIRDDLGLPTRLREIDEVKHEHLPLVATAVLNDRGIDRGPLGLNPSIEDIESLLDKAW